MLETLTWVDYIVVGVIVLSVLISLWRGLLREVLSLVAWVVAFIIACAFVDAAAARLVDYIPVPSVRIILAFGGLFLATLFLGGLVNILVTQIMQRTGLSSTDRLLGVFFGFTRGITIVAVVVLLASVTPLPNDPWWSQSLLLPYFQPLALWLRDFLPADLAENFAFS